MATAQAIAHAITFAGRAFAGVHARWAGCSPSETQRIYFANHTSHFDLLLVLASLPGVLRARTRPVAASDYWTQSKYRRYLASEVFHAVLIERSAGCSSCHPLRPVLNALDNGTSLVFFPEGTRGTGEELLPFKSGIYRLAAARPAVELVPVWIQNACRVMPKGSHVPLPLVCSTTFGRPVRLEDGEPKEVFLKRLRAALSSLADPRTQ